MDSKIYVFDLFAGKYRKTFIITTMIGKSGCSTLTEQY